MKKGIMSRVGVIIICIILLETLFLSVFAETKNEYKDKINNANKELLQLDGQIDKEMQDIEDLEEKISALNSEIINLNLELEKLEKSIKAKEKELTEKQKLLEERLVAMYIAGNTNYLDVLLSGGFVDFISNYYLVTQIAEYDTNLINEVEEIKTSLETEKADVQTKKVDKETKNRELQKLKAQKEKKVDTLTDEQKTKQSQIDDWNNKMKEIAVAERKAQSQSSSNNLKYEGGQLQWPVPSSKSITSYYGWRIHPIYNVLKFHSGIDIGASSGTNIVAAEDGEVILASNGNNGGYGNYIIINHGSGLTTRYAHCKELYVSVGQRVKKGQVVAAVGTTGASTGNHLHFEVRMNGETNDPINYLQ